MKILVVTSPDFDGKSPTSRLQTINRPEKKSRCVSHLPEVGYFVLHKSFMRAAPTDYSPLRLPLSEGAPSPLHSLISSVRQELSIFAKRSSQSPGRARGEAAEVSQTRQEP